MTGLILYTSKKKLAYRSNNPNSSVMSALVSTKDRDIPLFERIKFLGITASNLDEFFMVRVASLKDMVNAGYTKKDIAGMTPAEQLEGINRSKIQGLIADQRKRS